MGYGFIHGEGVDFDVIYCHVAWVDKTGNKIWHGYYFEKMSRMSKTLQWGGIRHSGEIGSGEITRWRRGKTNRDRKEYQW